MSKKTSKSDKERQIELSWQILEHKWRYYEGVKLGVVPIADEEYDKLESEYKNLCEKLWVTPTASDMVGFDYSRPSCKLVVERMMKGVK